MWRIVLGIFLAGHGLIHLGYITPAPSDPNYPFNMSKSWLITSVGIPEATVRLAGMTLSMVTVVGFALAGLAAVGFIVPQEWGPLLTVIAGVTSLLLLVLFWHIWLAIGILIDLALLAGLLWLDWQPFGATGA
jgi:hypothetical protein